MECSIEEWRPVKGFEGLYEVSNQGRVKRIKGGQGSVAGRTLKPSIDQKGYFHVILRKLGNSYGRLVHRLVTEVFLENPENLPEVNHVKGKEKWNNHVLNLEWSSSQNNIEHAVVTGLTAKGGQNGSAKLTASQVIEIRSAYTRGVTQKELANEYDVSNAQVCLIVNGKKWKHLLPSFAETA